MADVEIRLRVNGQDARASVEAATDARGLPPRALRAHRHAPRLRTRRVRGVHRARRRGRRAVVPHVRGASRRHRGHHRRRHERRRRLAVSRCRPRSAIVMACSAGSARPGSSCRSPRCCRTTRTRPTRRPVPRCPAISAAAPATRGSSRRSTSSRQRPTNALRFVVHAMRLSRIACTTNVRRATAVARSSRRRSG